MTSTPVKPIANLEKKDVQKLQRAIIDGLEDVKAQDIQVFDTEHITSLFERVIIASGTSNRQTKALAASVRDAVRDAGFTKPRIEGEENGEWIIVDCGAAVAHIMQPTIRQYYHLEELWGDKPIKLKLGAPAPLAKAAKAAPVVTETPVAKTKPGAKTAAKKRAKPGSKAAAKTVIKAPVKDHEPGYIGRLGKTSDWTAKRNEAAAVEEPVAKLSRTARKVPGTAAKTAVKAAVKSTPTTAVEKIPAARKAAAKKAPAKTAAKPAVKAAVKTVVKAAAKPSVKVAGKTVARKTTPRSR